jgi:glucose/arabinose dehydrogenase
VKLGSRQASARAGRTRARISLAAATALLIVTLPGAAAAGFDRTAASVDSTTDTVALRTTAGPAIGWLGATSARPAVTGGDPVLDIDEILSGYSRPVHLANAGGNDPRIFIVEQTGRIKVASDASGTWEKLGTFLDLSSSIRVSGEEGLLGLAFHPDYAVNGRFYVNFTRASDGANVIAEFRRRTANRADPESRRTLLTIPTVYTNHNGGMLAFGPDGMLYIATGDGGSSSDPENRGQRLDTLLGKLLRIHPFDPDGSGPKRYRIPADNPYVGIAGRDEIWSRGLRNPWKFSFDRATGDLWLGDVGQGSYEEVNHRTTGRKDNFGWRLLEGRHLYPEGTLCQTNCKVLPVIEYPHGADNCSVTGGYVYRGTAEPALQGRYVFGDYCSGRLWDVPESFSGTNLPTPVMTGQLISSFGEDAEGNLYVLGLGTGKVFRIDTQ